MANLPSRQLRAKLILPAGTFPGTSSNTLTLTGLRMSARIAGAGSYTNTCALSIYGMRQADMNAVTVLWGQDGNPQSVDARGILSLEASTDAGGWLQVFTGNFQEAQPNYQSPPDVCLTVLAITGYAGQILPASPLSVQGNADAALLALQLSRLLGFSFEDNVTPAGVVVKLQNPYLAGTLMDQWRDLMQQSGFDWYFSPDGKLVICPQNEARQQQTSIVLGPASGLIGYPTLTRNGIALDCLFSPAIELGLPLTVQGSQFPAAMNGKWFPISFEHSLDTIMPDGLWQSHLECLRFSTAGAS